VEQLHEIITGHEIPDVPQMELIASEIPAEPLPDAAPGEMVGVLEYLDARGGKEDVFRIAADINQEFGRVITVVKAVELMDFVDTPKRLVVLTPDGKRFVKATSQQRQVIWREQLLKLRIFKQVYDMMLKHPRKKLDADVAQEVIIFNLPSENYEKTFETFAHWAQFGNLFAFDEAERKLFFPRKRNRPPKPKTEARPPEGGPSIGGEGVAVEPSSTPETPVDPASGPFSPVETTVADTVPPTEQAPASSGTSLAETAPLETPPSGETPPKNFT